MSTLEVILLIQAITLAVLVGMITAVLVVAIRTLTEIKNLLVKINLVAQDALNVRNIIASGILGTITTLFRKRR